MWIASLTLASSILLLTACATKPLGATSPGGPNAAGTLSGTVHFVGTPCSDPGPPPCDGPYADYEVVVYATDGTTVAGKAKTSAEGAFSLDLPAGMYVLLTPAGITEQQRTEVVISRDALAKVELRVDTGIR